jgi:hypothetical protein
VLAIEPPEAAVAARLANPDNRFQFYDGFVGPEDLRMLPTAGGRLMALFGMNSGAATLSRGMWRAELASVGNATSLVEGSVQELRYPKAQPLEKNWVPFLSLPRRMVRQLRRSAPHRPRGDGWKGVSGAIQPPIAVPRVSGQKRPSKGASEH